MNTLLITIDRFLSSSQVLTRLLDHVIERVMPTAQAHGAYLCFKQCNPDFVCRPGRDVWMTTDYGWSNYPDCRSIWYVNVCDNCAY